MIFHLISGPRNISTAFMYAFAQRPDTQVLDEPFYAIYLQHTGLQHPGREEVLKSMSQNPEEVFALIEGTEEQQGNVFVKNMGHHLQGFDYSRIQNYQNIFLIRDPGQMLVSYAKVREQPTLNDIGLQHQADIYTWLAAQGQSPVVLDGNEIRKNPEKVLRQLCAQLAIPFLETMLHWPAGPRPEDGVWAPYWYHNVHQSTQFMPPDDASYTIPTNLTAIYEAALPYYQFLHEKAIKA